MDFRYDLVERESRDGGVREHARDERLEAALVLGGRPRALRRRADERADAAPRFEHSVALEMRVDASDGVRVDAQLDGELADRRQLIAGPEAAGGDRGPQSALDLGVDWGRIAGVDGDDAH